MNKTNRHKIVKVLINDFGGIIKIEVKDNNIEQAKSFKRKLQMVFLK